MRLLYKTTTTKKRRNEWSSVFDLNDVAFRIFTLIHTQKSKCLSTELNGDCRLYGRRVSFVSAAIKGINQFNDVMLEVRMRFSLRNQAPSFLPLKIALIYLNFTFHIHVLNLLLR